jgi:hypothetical protein
MYIVHNYDRFSFKFAYPTCTLWVAELIPVFGVEFCMTVLVLMIGGGD